MPELPEVETIKKDLCEKIIGQKITDVDLLWPGLVKGVSAGQFKKKVIGQKFVNVQRRAKNIDLKLSNGFYLLFHMKMTGHLILTDGSWQVDQNGKWIPQKGKDSPLYDPLNQFIRAIFYLSDGNILAFSDLRKFAYIKLLDEEGLKKTYAEYGPEPFSKEFTVDSLKKLLGTKKIAIKKVLTDQKSIAGIGNIYADEILWEIKVHPLTRACDIPENKIKELHGAIKKILSKAVEMRGTSTSDFRDLDGKKGEFGTVLKVYRRTGLPCECGGKVERITLGGRGTHFCPTCQKLEGS